MGQHYQCYRGSSTKEILSHWNLPVPRHYTKYACYLTIVIIEYMNKSLYYNYCVCIICHIWPVNTLLVDSDHDTSTQVTINYFNVTEYFMALRPLSNIMFFLSRYMLQLNQFPILLLIWLFIVNNCDNKIWKCYFWHFKIYFYSCFIFDVDLSKTNKLLI